MATVAVDPPLGHVPVMLDEMLTGLAVHAGGAYVDGTFGAGGYSRAILAAGAGRVIGLDRDPAALDLGRALAAADARFTMTAGRFGDLSQHLATLAIDQIDGLVLDLGLSSRQLDDPARGFSFAADGPLDMRMDRAGPSAADLVNQADEQTLASIIHRYGEERAARRIARAIVARRGQGAITRTRELAELVAQAVGRHGERIDPATRTFQALRIHVNDELGELERALAATDAVLRPGGRLVVIAFHSLEDRIVKQFLAARAAQQPRPSRHLPELPAARGPIVLRPLQRRPLRPSAAEVLANPRARSARLRAAERLPEPGEAR
jgi:16S rRNA (cytosine1402-N4)-methyltransferase